jgi:hypothetical protein
VHSLHVHDECVEEYYDLDASLRSDEYIVQASVSFKRNVYSLCSGAI